MSLLPTPQNIFSNIPLFKVTNFSSKKLYTFSTQNIEPILSEHLQKCFDKILEKDQILRDLVLNLHQMSSRGVVFGGWVRDQIINYYSSHQIQSRDIDIVINGLTPLELHQLLPQNTTSNVFGGYTTATSTNSLDIWLLENTFLIRKLNLAVDFKTLPKTTVFRINSVIFQPEQLWLKSEINQAGCVDAISQQVIDFQTSSIPFPCIQCGRAIIYSIKLKFDLALEVKQFIREICLDEKNYLKIREDLEFYCPKEFLEDALHLFTYLTHI